MMEGMDKKYAIFLANYLLCYWVEVHSNGGMTTLENVKHKIIMEELSYQYDYECVENFGPFSCGISQNVIDNNLRLG